MVIIATGFASGSEDGPGAVNPAGNIQIRVLEIHSGVNHGDVHIDTVIV
jgi:hypothetical protein